MMELGEGDSVGEVSSASWVNLEGRGESIREEKSV